jgi:hypothetical protein
MIALCIKRLESNVTLTNVHLLYYYKAVHGYLAVRPQTKKRRNTNEETLIHHTVKEQILLNFVLPKIISGCKTVHVNRLIG